MLWLNMVVLSIFFAMFGILLGLKPYLAKLSQQVMNLLPLKSLADDRPKELSLDPWVG